MRRFFIENRRTITMIIVAALGILMAKTIMDYTSSFEKRIVNNNEKVYYNSKKVFIKDIKIDGITNKRNVEVGYTTINLDLDEESEVIIRIQKESVSKYFIVDRINDNINLMQDIEDEFEIWKMKKGGVILKEDGTLIKISYDNNNHKLSYDTLAYLEGENYIIGENKVSKFEYDTFIKSNYKDLYNVKWN